MHPAFATIQYVGGDPPLKVKFYEENGTEIAYNSIILNVKIRPIPKVYQYIKDETGFHTTYDETLLEEGARVLLHIPSIETETKLEDGKTYDIAWHGSRPEIVEFRNPYSLFWQGEKELLRGTYLAFYPLCLAKTPPPDSRRINDALWVLFFAPATLILFVILSVILYRRFRSKGSRTRNIVLEGIFWSAILCWVFLGFSVFLLFGIPQFFRMYPWVL